MELAYTTYGGGPPLLILHGLLGSSGNWHTLSSKAFGEQFQVFAIDLRNHGRSPHSDTFDYSSMVSDLVELMDAQELDTAHVLGHSMGGKVAMHLALTHPARVEKLVVVDVAPKAYDDRHSDILEALRSIDPSAYGSRKEIDAALGEHIPNLGVRQFLLKNLSYDTDRKTYTWQMNLESIYENYAALNAAIEPGVTFEGPALFIRGGASDYIADDDLPQIRTFFPEADLVTIDGAGHWVHAEQPEALAEAVLHFLNA